MGKNKIQLFVPKVTYYGGDVIYGICKLIVEKELKSRGVRFIFTGEEHVYFQEANNSTYSDDHIFLSHRIDFAGVPRKHRKNAKAEIVGPGVYRWPFTIALPPYLPSSVKFDSFNRGVSGSIRYTMCAYVDIPRHLDLCYTILIPVGGFLYDHNAFSLPTPPVCKSNDKSFLFLSSNKKMKMTATIPVWNFFVGEKVPIQVVVENKSKKSVKSITAYLQQDGRFHADGHVRSLSSILGKTHHAKTIPKFSTFKFTIDYIIPDATPTMNPGACLQGPTPKLVHTYHCIVVCLEISMAFNLKVKIPINIMHVNPRAIHSGPTPMLAPVYSPVPSGKVDPIDRPMQAALPVGFYGPPAGYPPPAGPYPAVLPQGPPSAIPPYPVIEKDQYPNILSSALSIGTGDIPLDDEESSVLRG